MHTYAPCMHIHPSMCTDTCLPMCTSAFIRASLLTLAPHRGFLARYARSTQLQAAKLIERSERRSLPSEQRDIESNNVGCGAHLEAPRPTHGGICMHIWAYMCIHGAYVCTRRGMCAEKYFAACDCKYPESAHLLASHSLPTVSDLRNSFFSAFGTSKIGGGGGTFMGGWVPMCVKIQIRATKSYMPYIHIYILQSTPLSPTLGGSTIRL